MELSLLMKRLPAKEASAPKKEPEKPAQGKSNTVTHALKSQSQVSSVEPLPSAVRAEVVTIVREIMGEKVHVFLS